MKSNRYPWLSFLLASVLQKSCCENIAKFTEKDMYQDPYFDKVGGSTPERIKGGVQLVLLRYYYCMGSSMESIANVVSYVYQQFLRMLDLWRQKPNNNNKTKYKFLEVFLMMHNFLDMSKCFSNQLKIIHK